MRTRLFFLAAAVLLLTCTSALADGGGYQYDFSSSAGGGLGTVNIVFDEPTLMASGVATSFLSATDSMPGATIVNFSWNSVAGGECYIYDHPGLACAGYSADGGTNAYFVFPPGSFLSPGIYADGIYGTLTITARAATAPEPGSLSLIVAGVLGLGLLAGMKRQHGDHLPTQP